MGRECGGEPGSEQSAPTGDARLHSAQRHPQHRRDLLVGEVLDVTEDDGRAEFQGEGQQRLPQRPGALPLLGVHVRAHRGVREIEHDPVRPLQRGGRPARVPAVDVVGGVDGHPDQPGTEAVGLELRRPNEGAQEGLLDDVGGVLGFAEQAEAHAVQRILVALDEHGEGVAVTPPAPLEERGVGHRQWNAAAAPAVPGGSGGRARGMKNVAPGLAGPIAAEEPVMPAVTVADLTALPRVDAPREDAPERAVLSLHDAPSGFEGEGFPVRRAFAGVPMERLDPFIHMDQMGEVEYAPGEPKGTPWHPHRGFETVTYIMDGTFVHHDSNGGGGVITDGDTQWMTAGAGILHIETPPEELVMSGGLFHGIQLWVNLPSAQKFTAPRYQDIGRANVTLLADSGASSLLRVIAGEVGGRGGPGVTHTPMTMVHATVAPGTTLRLPWAPDNNGLVYTLAGTGSVGVERAPLRTGRLAVLGGGTAVTVHADAVQESRSPQLEILLLGGRPIGEPVAWQGPFVMNTHAELAQAFADYRSGRLGTVPAEFA